MAKFRNGNLVLTNSQNIRIGDITLSRNADGEFESNVAFVAPDSTSSNTLATRAYVDSVAGGGGGGGAFTEDGSQNIFGGTNAGSSLTTGSYNFFVGNGAGSSVEDANENVFIGRNSGRDTVGGASVSGDWNIAIGSSALERNVEGLNNIAIGYQSAQFLENDITQSSDIFIGYTAGRFYGGVSVGSEGGNVVIGYEAGLGSFGGVPPLAGYTDCVMIGKNAGRNLKEGSGNVFIGLDSYAGAGVDGTTSNTLIITNNSDENLIEGDFAARTLQVNGTLTVETLITDATSVIIGNTTLTEKSGGGLLVDGAEVGGGLFSEDGSNNIVGGTGAGASFTSAANNFLAGNDAGANITSGNRNVFIGRYAGRYSETGASNVYIGQEAGEGVSGNSNDFNVAIGDQSMTSITTGDHNTCIGYASGSDIASSINNTFIGSSAGTNITGSSNVCVGRLAGSPSTDQSISGIVAIGFEALDSVERNYNIAIGYQAAKDLTTSQQNTIIGYQAGFNLTTSGGSNVIIGYQADYYNETSGSNVIIGQGAGVGASGVSTFGRTIVGTAAGRLAQATITAIGYQAGYNFTSSAGFNTLVGYNAARYLENGGYNTVIGTEAGFGNSGAATMNYAYCTFVGLQAGKDTETANRSTGIGYLSMENHVSGNSNTCVGASSGRGSGAVTGNFFQNTFIGESSGLSADTCNNNVGVGFRTIYKCNGGDWNTAIGNQAMQGPFGGSATSPAQNTAVGNQSLYIIEDGSYNTAMGYFSGDSILDGEYNTLIGYDTDVSDSTAINRIALGANVVVDADNKAQIGDSSVTTIGGYATWTDYSDRSIKTNIQDSDIGIEFIRRLRTRRFEKKDQPGKMHDGLIAQEVKEVMDELGIDFSGWVEPGSNGLQMLQYPTFVMPLINAATKQQEELESLRSEVETLKRQMSEIIGQLKK